MSESVQLPMKKGFGATDRVDGWWKGPTAMALYLGIMVVYSTWRGFMEADIWIFSGFGASSCDPTVVVDGVVAACQTMAIESEGSHVLSPLFSPLIIPGEAGLASPIPEYLWWMSPAMFILIFPAGFRGTCYYYRKAYYRAFFQQPTACAVSVPWNEYKGETGLLLVQNLHRYFLYAAICYLPILSYDVWMSMNFHDPVSGANALGLSVGSLVLAINVVALGGYTFGCHAFRHLVGGGTNQWTNRDSEGGSKPTLRYRMWNMSTWFNEHHKDWALYSLFIVMFADFYIYACTSGWWTDVVLWGGL